MKYLLTLALLGAVALMGPHNAGAQSRNLLMGGAKIDDGTAVGSILLKTASGLGATGQFTLPLPGTLAGAATNTNVGAMWTTATADNVGLIHMGTLPVTLGGTGSLTAFTQGSIVFAGASGIYSQDNANFFWDDVAHSLDLGGDVAFNAGADHTIAVTAPASSGAGNTLNLSAAAANTEGAGGNLTLTAGNAATAIAGDQNGGNITLTPGTNTGAGVGGNIVLNNVATDASATSMLTLNGSGQVRQTTLTGTADQGLVFTGGKYLLGSTLATGAGSNPLTANRNINLLAHTLSFNGLGDTAHVIFDGSAAGTNTLKAGANNIYGTTSINASAANVSTTNINTDNANSGTTNINYGSSNTGSVIIGNASPTATGSIVMGSGGVGTISLTGTTQINTLGAKQTTIGSTATGGNVSINANIGTDGIVAVTAKNVNVTGATTVVGTTLINDANNANTSINTGNSTGAVHIADGTGANSVAVGNASTTALTVLAPTTINTDNNQATSINAGSSTGAVHIADGTGANSVAIGNTNSTAVTVLGPTTINASNNAGTSINTGSSTGTVAIGNAASTTNVQGATNINDGTSATATTIGGGSSTGDVNIGRGVGNTLKIGNTTSSTITATELKGTANTSAVSSNGTAYDQLTTTVKVTASDKYSGVIATTPGFYNYQVNNTLLTAASAVIVTYNDPNGGDMVTPYVSAKTVAGTPHFRVTLSGDPASGSTINYIIVNP